MKSSEILLSLDYENLEVFKNPGGICVMYKGADVKSGIALKGEYGVGIDFESACDDYLNKIRGKKLVFNDYGDNRKEIIVLG